MQYRYLARLVGSRAWLLWEQRSQGFVLRISCLLPNSTGGKEIVEEILYLQFLYGLIDVVWVVSVSCRVLVR